MWGRASEGSGGKEGGGDLRLGGRGEGKGGWSGVERSGWGRGGPLSALEPGTIERGGFGQCRCRGRAGPQGYVQSQGRPRGTADPSRKAVSRNRPPCEDRRTIKARSHLRLCSIGFSSVCCIVRMIDPAAFLQGYFCDHVCCRLPFAVCRLPFAVCRLPSAVCRWPFTRSFSGATPAFIAPRLCATATMVCCRRMCTSMQVSMGS